MRLWATWGVLVVMLAVGTSTAFEPLHRPDAVLAPTQQRPMDAGSAVATAWTVDGPVGCDQVCKLVVPAGASGTLWVSWNGSRSAGFAAELDGAMGVLGFDAIRVGRVAGGEALTLWGTGDAHLAVLPDLEGVPELAALVPANLGRELPATGHGDPSRQAPSCLEEEVEELGLRGCLRFTSGVANVGDTPLALASDVRAGEARMTQALPGGDRRVGLATYHDVHSHFHYARFVAFELHTHDPLTGLRGPQVGASSKTGFCMVDFGRVADAPVAGDKTYWRDGCAPGQATLAMGLNPGWYDIYRWFLPEQAIETTALPAGTYELVVTIDPAGSLVEGNPLDDRASVLFAWDGATATVLGARGLYRLVPEPS